jgi:hypothetical protein
MLDSIDKLATFIPAGMTTGSSNASIPAFIIELIFFIFLSFHYF